MLPDCSARTRLVLAAVLVVALLALAGCSRPGPPSICAVCSDDVEYTAADLGANVTVERSVLDVTLREDGSARWEARVTLGGEVDRLRHNGSLRRGIVRRQFQRNRGPNDGLRENVTVTIDGDALVVTYVTPGVAERRAGGLLLVDHFFDHDPTVGSGYYLSADRLVLHPPAGWVVLNDPPDGTVRRDTVAWEHAPSPRTYVVVGPRGTRAAVATGQAVVAAEVAGWALAPWLGVSALPSVLLGALAFLLLGRVDHEPPRRPDLAVNGELVGAATVAVTALGIAGVAVAAVHGRVSIGLAGAVIVFVGPSVIPFLATGALAHRRPAVRWPPAVLAAGTAPLVGLWLVLSSGGATGLEGAAMLVWTGLVGAAGTLSFLAGRRYSALDRNRPRGRDRERRR